MPEEPAPVVEAKPSSDPKLVEKLNDRIESDKQAARAKEVEALAEKPREKVSHAGPAPKRLPKKKEEKKLHHRATPWNPKFQKKETEEERAQKIIALAMDRDGQAALLKQINSELAKVDFSEFCRQAWHVVEPATKLQWNWHHQLVCEVLQALFEDWLKSKRDEDYVNAVRNTVFNLPPGSLKSRLIAVFFMAWCWIRQPGMKFICLSVNEDASLRDARAARDLIRSDWYQTTFSPEWKLKGDQDAISNYGNTAGGERLSKPTGSEIVGLRGDCLLIDDANNPHEAENATEREKVNSLWDTNIYNRVNDPLRSLRIGVQQRTNAEDWTGHVLLKQGVWTAENPNGWLHVVVPAEFEAERRFVMPTPLKKLLKGLKLRNLVLDDPRKEEGESVHPERFSKEYLAAERKRWEGTGNYAGQMQQRPALVEGARIKRGYFNWCRLDKGIRLEFDGVELKRPRPAHCDQHGESQLIKAKHHAPGYWDFDWMVISIDCAVKKTDRGSNWGILVVAGSGGRRYVLDDKTKRTDILDVVSILRDLVKFWKPDKILIEAKAASEDLKLRLLDEMNKGDIPMITLEEVKVPNNTGKEERLDSCISVLANRMVHLLDGAPWLEAFVEELTLFPHGARDDRVDALTQVLNAYKDYVEDALPDW